MSVGHLLQLHVINVHIMRRGRWGINSPFVASCAAHSHFCMLPPPPPSVQPVLETVAALMLEDQGAPPDLGASSSHF